MSFRAYETTVTCPYLNRKVDADEVCGNCRAHGGETFNEEGAGIICKPPMCGADSTFEATLGDCSKCVITCSRRSWLEWIQKKSIPS